MSTRIIVNELKQHAPFTALGTLTGIVLMAVIIKAQIPRETSAVLFWTCHPAHVFLSALVTTAMYRLHGNRGFWKTLAVGYFGSVGIATLSDSIIPFIGEILLDLPNRGLHLGFIEKWWLVNPLAFAGIAWGCFWPRTKFPHAAHVLLSTWASLFHITMSLGTAISAGGIVLVVVFLFLAVWVPCCTSDIVFPLLFSKDRKTHE
jgi:hypothetical protein